MSVFSAITRMLERTPEWPGAVGVLARNPAAMAEVLVLFRMVLADGVVDPSQMAVFERICEQHFRISPQDMPDLHALLDSPRARSCEAEAFMLLTQLDTDGRTALLGDMMRIARANSVVDASEARLIGRIATLLGLEPEAVLGEKKGTGNE